MTLPLRNKRGYEENILINCGFMLRGDGRESG